MEPPKSNAKASLAICSLFESELLLRLMLLHWNHPRADDEEFRLQLLETATEVLEAASTIDDQVFVEGIPPSQMNFVAAVWYAERRALEECQSHADEGISERLHWLRAIQRALPSCFCDPNELA